MWPFKKRKPETPEEKAALEKLDERVRDAAWASYDRYHGLAFGGDLSGRPFRPPDGSDDADADAKS